MEGAAWGQTEARGGIRQERGGGGEQQEAGGKPDEEEETEGEKKEKKETRRQEVARVVAWWPLGVPSQGHFGHVWVSSWGRLGGLGGFVAVRWGRGGLVTELVAQRGEMSIPARGLTIT